MIYRDSDPHEILDEVLKNLRVEGLRPAVVKSRWSAVNSSYRPVRIFIVLVRSLAMVMDIVRAASSTRYVIVREFWNVPLLLMVPVLLGWRRRILWNVNHNLRNDSGGCPPVLSLAARGGFRFLLFDGSIAAASFPPHVRRAFSTPLFPVAVRSANRRARPDVVRVSLVGEMRLEKIASGSLELVIGGLCRLPGVSLRIGVRRGVLPGAALPPGVELVDTSTREQYLKLLEDSDVVVILARRDAYYYRNSGTVLDAVSCGAWPIVPAFPVMKVQVGHPARVGSTYESESGIADAVEDAIDGLGSGDEQRSLYFLGRGLVNLELSGQVAGKNHD